MCYCLLTSSFCCGVSKSTSGSAKSRILFTSLIGGVRGSWRPDGMSFPACLSLRILENFSDIVLFTELHCQRNTSRFLLDQNSPLFVSNHQTVEHFSCFYEGNQAGFIISASLDSAERQWIQAALPPLATRGRQTARKDMRCLVPDVKLMHKIHLKILFKNKIIFKNIKKNSIKNIKIN